MKLSANLSFLFQDLPFEDRFEASKKAGFKAVEMMFPYGYPAEEIAKLLKTNDLSFALFNAPPGDWNNGERGIAALPGRQQEFQESFQLALSYCRVMQCRNLHVMAGILPRDFAPHECYAVLSQNLKWALPQAKEAGVSILLEPLNPDDMPGYLYSRIEEVTAFLDRMNDPNLRLQLDLYHQEKHGGNCLQILKDNLNSVEHIQLAHPNSRNEPVNMSWKVGELAKLLAESGYQGYVGCEYKPANDTLAGLEWAAEWLET